MSENGTVCTLKEKLLDILREELSTLKIEEMAIDEVANKCYICLDDSETAKMKSEESISDSTKKTEDEILLNLTKLVINDKKDSDAVKDDLNSMDVISRNVMDISDLRENTEDKILLDMKKLVINDKKDSDVAKDDLEAADDTGMKHYCIETEENKNKSSSDICELSSYIDISESPKAEKEGIFTKIDSKNNKKYSISRYLNNKEYTDNRNFKREKVTASNDVEGASKTLQSITYNDYSSNKQYTKRPKRDYGKDQILKQCESMFQDYNILKNSYLLRKVQQNKEGYIPVKLLATFRKLKPLTNRCQLQDVIDSLEKSEIFELNPEKTKVRRKIPVPKVQDTPYGKTVMVFSCQQTLTQECLIELFCKFGRIVSANVFKTPARDPYHRRCLYFHQEIAPKYYGIVEYEEYFQAVNALADEEGYLPKENKMIVVPLMPQVFHKERRRLQYLRSTSNRQYNRQQYEPKSRSYKSVSVISRENVSERKTVGYTIPRVNDRKTVGYIAPKVSYRQTYRERKPYAQSTGKFYSRPPSVSYTDMRNERFMENRQLKTSNRQNTNRGSGYGYGYSCSYNQ